MANRTLQLNIEKSLQNSSAMSAQDLIATTANVIGTAYKGTAFVPKKIVSSSTSLFFDADGSETSTYNTRGNMIGSSRQNRHEHLYDDYSCNVDGNGYDAVSVWLDNGGTQATFTRILGIGNGIEDPITGKMQESGFNAANNISSGTLSQSVSPNLNAVANGVKGNVSFLFKTVNEKSKRSDGVADVNSDVETIDYLDELFCNENKDTTEINVLSDVMIFASGVLPSLSSEESIDNFDYYEYDSIPSDYSTQVLQTSNKKQNFIDLKGFTPYIKSENHKPFNFFQNSYLDTSNYIEKQTIYSNPDKNYFSSRFLEKGYFTYATFPLCGINDHLTPHKRFTLLTSKPYEEINSDSVPDYNSFESEFSTAKTPWITSQPLFRTSFGNTTTDNRKEIHQSVQNLFRFWSLDDGDVGNKFRIKINPAMRGEPNTETNYMSDNEFASFDIYIFLYEARINRYVNIETYKDVNLHPNSPNYISNLIGDSYEYYDFKLGKVVQKGFFKNKSQFLRVEVDKTIEEKTLKIQHQLIPSGFRSYPHISFKKEAFEMFGNEESVNALFDTQGIYQMPPMYVLNKYTEYDKSYLVSHINNHWGVVFNRSKVKNNILMPDRLKEHNNPTAENVSPHFYYSKYFLTGNNNSQKDIWVEQDNYLNSFFHLEKILVKTDSEENVSLSKYKHSGRTPSNTTNYKYLNLSDDSLWLFNRKLKNTYRDKLSFDFFTYGGFDGTDIRDQDKKNFRNDAIIRELYDSNEKKSTYSAYDLAIDIAANDTTCAGDILIVPGIKEIPIVKKCMQICEEDRRHFYLADISGAASSSNILYFNDETGDQNVQVFSTKGIMGQYFKIENDLSRYTFNKSAIKVNDNEIKLKQENNPETGDYFTYFNYTSIVEHFYETMYDLWESECITSRYLLASYGDLIVNFQGDSQRQMSSDLFTLGKIAQNFNPNNSISSNGSIVYHGSRANTSLILQHLLNFNCESFEDYLVKARKNSINVIYTPKNQNARLLTELTSYENRKHIFKEQRYIRAIQEVKKIIKYSVFLDESFIQGGLFFTQNSSLNNIYQKFEIQMNLLMQNLVDTGYITGFLVKIQKPQDEKTMLDMQNYIIRGNIVLQFDNSDIINLEIDDVLSDLSLLANPGQDAVYIPR